MNKIKSNIIKKNFYKNKMDKKKKKEFHSTIIEDGPISEKQSTTTLRLTWGH